MPDNRPRTAAHVPNVAERESTPTTVTLRFLAGLAVAVFVAAGCGGDDAAVEPEPDIDGLVTYGDLSAEHETGELTYDTVPPVGGDHNPFWQACGYYTVPVYLERAVHSMEHGAVWIAYTPGTEVSTLVPTVQGDDHLLMSPVDGLDAPLVLSAWGAQVSVDGPDDPRITAFIDQFVRQGPESAPCVGGGVGVPPEDIGPGLDV
jgi:hypothetical protein